MPLSKEKKGEYFTKLTRMFSTYSKVFVVSVDNVGSQQMNLTRKSMRGTAGSYFSAITLKTYMVFSNNLQLFL